MANTKTTHPFSVQRWSPPLGGDYKGILFSTGYWMELARTTTLWRAEQLVYVWRIVYRDDVVKILDVSGKNSIIIAFYPDKATVEAQTSICLPQPSRTTGRCEPS